MRITQNLATIYLGINQSQEKSGNLNKKKTKPRQEKLERKRPAVKQVQRLVLNKVQRQKQKQALKQLKRLRQVQKQLKRQVLKQKRQTQRIKQKK